MRQREVIMKDSEKLISQTIKYIEQHLDEDLNLNDIAKFTGYSKFHLNRIFSENVGCTLYKYITKRRLTEAARLLVHSDIPIAQIALEANYESQQAFTLAFRRLYLKTPQSYRDNRVFVPIQMEHGIGLKEQKIYANTLYFMNEYYRNHYNKKEMKAA
jgi:AraC-like DNA-binding protein